MVAAPYITPINRPIRLAQRCLEKLGLRPPIDVMAVIQACGLRVHELEITTNVDGCLAYHPGRDRFGIFANSRFHDELRRRFTLAHELGHYICHRELIRQAGTTGILETPWMEDEASAFAAELLMPAAEVRLSGNLLEYQVRSMYGVSMTAWRYRINQVHGYWPS